MKLEFFTGRMGCGMGICTVGQYYLQEKRGGNKEYGKLSIYPKTCQECIKGTNAFNNYGVPNA